MKLDYYKHERGLQLIRNATIPKNPTNCLEIHNAFQNENIMQAIGFSQHAEKNIFFDGVIDTGLFTYCVFSSKDIIKQIEKKIDVQERKFMMDATFKVCPCGPFNQLLIIYIAYHEKVRYFSSILFHFFIIKTSFVYFFL